MDGMKGTIKWAINTKVVVLILLFVFLGLLFLFQMGLKDKILSVITPILKIWPG